ncbi:MAG: hypothetical protein IKZ12_06940 [Alistipes sp.]|nr:hypothetical protein [Alistipes sp.]
MWAMRFGAYIPILSECGALYRLFLLGFCQNLFVDKRESSPHFLFITTNHRTGDATVTKTLSVMGIVSLKCPSCGASLQLDDAMQNAFCAYCGGQIKVQQEIRNIKLDKSADLANLLVLIKEDVEAGDYELAQSRVQKALEIDPQSPDLWYYNLCCIGQCSLDEYEDYWIREVQGDIMGYNKFKLAQRTAANMIKYGKDDTKYKKIINIFYLVQSARCLLDVVNQLSDVDYVHNRLAELEDICYPGQIAHWGQHEHEEIMNQEDADFVETCLVYESLAFDMLDEVDVAYFDIHSYENGYVECIEAEILDYMAESYEDATKALNYRFGLYNTHISDEAVEERKEHLNIIKSLRPQSYVEYKEALKEALDKESSNEKEPENGDSGSLFIAIGSIFMLVIIVLFILMCS